MTDAETIADLCEQVERLQRSNADLVANIQHVQSDRQAIVEEMERAQAEARELAEERNYAIRQAAETRAAFRALRSLVLDAMTAAREVTPDGR